MPTIFKGKPYKNKQMKKRLVVTAVLALSGLVSFAQGDAGTAVPKKAYKKWSIGLNGGITQFYGDLRQYNWAPVIKNNNSSRPEVGFGFQGNLSRSFNHIFGLRGNLSLGNLAGMKRASGGNTRYFRTNFVQYDLVLTANISNMFYSDMTKDRPFTIYGFGGVGLMHFRSLVKKTSNDEFVASQGYKNRGTEKKEFTSETVFPIGGGIRYKLSKSLALTAEGTMFNTISDKLDATVRANTAKDRFFLGTVGVVYKFGKKGAEESIEWVNPYADINSNMEQIKTNIDGLSKDADGDGVSDMFDKEPNTAAGVAVDGAGRAMDTDVDGVPDHLDADPFTAKGAKVGSDGREIDSDGDGVADSKDLEPNTPSGSLVNFQGKKIEVKPVAAEQTTSSTTVAGGLPSIFFKVNSSQVDYWSAYDKLAEVAQALKSSPSSKLRVIGNADQNGSESYNKTLAEKRAKAAADQLTKVFGIDTGRIMVESRGAKEPLSKVKDGFNVNRRVDFQLVK